MILSESDFQTMKWKNGLGSTTQLMISPQDALPELLNYTWRLSIADVTKDGVFSIFPGFNRDLTLIEGEGMALDAGRHGQFELNHQYESIRFSGDWDVEARLIDGSIRDLNLIYDRSSVCGHVEMMNIGPFCHLQQDTDTLIIYQLKGPSLDIIDSEGNKAVVEAGQLYIRQNNTETTTFQLQYSGGMAIIAGEIAIIAVVYIDYTEKKESI